MKSAYKVTTEVANCYPMAISDPQMNFGGPAQCWPIVFCLFVLEVSHEIQVVQLIWKKKNI